VKDRFVFVTNGIFSFGDKSLFFKLVWLSGRADGGSRYFVSGGLLILLEDSAGERGFQTCG